MIEEKTTPTLCELKVGKCTYSFSEQDAFDRQTSDDGKEMIDCLVKSRNGNSEKRVRLRPRAKHIAVCGGHWKAVPAVFGYGTRDWSRAEDVARRARPLTLPHLVGRTQAGSGLSV